MSSQPKMNKHKSWASYEDSDNEDDGRSRSHSKSPGHHGHHHHQHQNHNYRPRPEGYNRVDGDIEKKAANSIKYEIYQGSEIIAELKDVPPSQSTAIVIYNVPYDCTEEEIAEFTKDFNVSRVKELKQGMYKLEFSKSENALAFIKAELNVIKGRDLIFRVNRERERTNDGYRGDYKPRGGYNNREDRGGYNNREDRGDYKGNRDFNENKGDREFKEYRGNRGGRSRGGYNNDRKDYYDQLMDEDNSQSQSRGGRGGYRGDRGSRGGYQQREDYHSRGGYQPREDYQSRGGYKRGGYNNYDDNRPAYDKFERKQHDEEETEESKKLVFKGEPPKFISHKPKIIPRVEEKVNEPAKEQHSNSKAKAPQEKEHNSSIVRKSTIDSGVQTENPTSEKRDGERFKGGESKGFGGKELKQWKPDASKKRPNNEWVRKEVREEELKKDSNPLPHNDELAAQKEREKEGDREHGRINKDSQEFKTKYENNYHKYSDNPRPYNPSSKPYKQNNYKEKKGKYEDGKPEFMFVPKTVEVAEAADDKKQSPKSKKKLQPPKKESKNTSNVFEVLKPK